MYKRNPLRTVCFDFQFEVTLRCAGDKKNNKIDWYHFYYTKMDDLCPKFEKDGTMKDVMEMMGFVNQTCPIDLVRKHF